MIAMDDLRKQFSSGRGRQARSVVAVDGMTLHARDGAITGLLGPNGAGKTTSLRMLVGLVTPDSGTIRVDGIDLRDDPQGVRARLGVLSDARGLYPRLTARENVRYFGALHGLSGAGLDARIDTLFATLGLGAIAERRTAGFSQGEKMKVAIARALVHDPHTILLDEPTNGLDIMSVRTLRDELRALRRAGKCLLFSSHVMQEVAALCDRIVVLSQGRVVAMGTADELVARAGTAGLEDAFVALLGSDEGLAA